MIFLLSYSRTAIKISYLCIVKISEGMSARTRKNYFSRALGNSATCGSKSHLTNCDRE